MMKKYISLVCVFCLLTSLLYSCTLKPPLESSEETSKEKHEYSEGIETSRNSSDEISEENSEEISEEASEEVSEEYSEEVSAEETLEAEKAAITGEYFDSLGKKAKKVVTNGFLDWVASEYGGNVIKGIKKSLDDGTYTEEKWYELTKNTVLVLDCYYKNVFDTESEYYRDDVKVIGDTDGSIVIRITGDFSLADNWDIMPKYDARGQGLEGVLSKRTIECLQSADITLVNNEFCYSKRGTPLPGKAWTFRADPSRVSIFNELGVDVVSLANNHAYDYGADAFLDTMQTLRDADIPYIGGGKDLDEAQKPFYFIVNGRMISFAAASRAEVNKMTPQATDTAPGILRTYDATLYNGVLKKAAENSDYCVAYVHWGVEDSHEIGEGLYEMGAGYIDSGADIVVGAHAHLLQGIEFYDGVPIVFNLGNFLFTSESVRTAIFELTLDADTLDPVYRIIPCLQSGTKTEIVDEGSYYWTNIIDFMRSHSYKVKFTDDGYFTAE